MGYRAVFFVRVRIQRKAMTISLRSVMSSME